MKNTRGLIFQKVSSKQRQWKGVIKKSYLSGWDTDGGCLQGALDEQNLTLNDPIIYFYYKPGFRLNG